MSRVNRNTEYSSTTSRRGRCYQICVAVWAAAVIKLCIYDLIMTMKVIQAFENFVTGLWWSTSLWIPYLILISSSLLLYRITETIDSLQNRIEECMSYKRLHDFESLTRNVVPLIDDDFEKKFCDFSDKVLTGVGESYNALCGCIDFFNEVFGSLMFVLVATVVIFQLSLIYYLALNASQNNTLETFTQVIHTTILTIGIILVAMGGENLQDAATGLRRSLTRLNNEVLQDERLTTLCQLLRALLRAMSSSRLSVSSCGLFHLRMSFVTGLISFTSTYAIVVLQLTNLI